MPELLIFITLVIAVTGFRIVEVRAISFPALLRSHDLWLRCLYFGTIATLLSGLAVLSLIALAVVAAPSAVLSFKPALLISARVIGLTTPNDLVGAAALAISALSFLIAPLGYRAFSRPLRLPTN
jgi:hypothetical protein